MPAPTTRQLAAPRRNALLLANQIQASRSSVQPLLDGVNGESRAVQPLLDGVNGESVAVQPLLDGVNGESRFGEREWKRSLWHLSTLLGTRDHPIRLAEKHLRQFKKMRPGCVRSSSPVP
jgi:hypothetical protein